MGVAVECQLTGYAYGQTVEHFQVLFREMALHKVYLLVAADLLGLRHSEHIVKLSDKFLDSRDKLNHALGDNDRTEVIAIGSTGDNGFSDVVHNIVETHAFGLNLLRDKADIRLCLKCTLKSDMRSRAPHHLNEVPILAR